MLFRRVLAPCTWIQTSGTQMPRCRPSNLCRSTSQLHRLDLVHGVTLKSAMSVTWPATTSVSPHDLPLDQYRHEPLLDMGYRYQDISGWWSNCGHLILRTAWTWILRRAWIHRWTPEESREATSCETCVMAADHKLPKIIHYPSIDLNKLYIEAGHRLFDWCATFGYIRYLDVFGCNSRL